MQERSSAKTPIRALRIEQICRLSLVIDVVRVVMLVLRRQVARIDGWF